MGLILKTFKQTYVNMNDDGKTHYRWVTFFCYYNKKRTKIHSWSIFWTKWKEEKTKSFSSIYTIDKVYNGEKMIRKSLNMMGVSFFLKIKFWCKK